MAQPFDCLCGTPTCRGRISGARDMTLEQLDGLWLNGHIRELLEEREAQKEQGRKQGQNGGTAAAAATSNGRHGVVAAPARAPENGAFQNGTHHTPAAAAAAPETVDQTVRALRDALAHAEKVVEAARLALVSYAGALQADGFGKANGNGNGHAFDSAATTAVAEASAGLQRRGPTSRELSGEMGGDTSVPV